MSKMTTSVKNAQIWLVTQQTSQPRHLQVMPKEVVVSMLLQREKNVKDEG